MVFSIYWFDINLKATTDNFATHAGRGSSEMESFKQFLETASINGLNHISSTRKWTKLFWITLVTLGFVVSTILIWESFQTWSENPIRTTTKTVPIEEIKFPKLTVCPPKNTFTDLNYDLMLAEKVPITNETKNELYEYVVELIDEHVYMDPWDKLHEENRFFNWYTGLTSMHYGPTHQTNVRIKSAITNQYVILTSAPSGVITSQYFGERYNPTLVEEQLEYIVKVYPDQNIHDNENVTLHVKIERVPFPVQCGGHDDFSYSHSLFSSKQEFFNKNSSPPSSGDPISDLFDTGVDVVAGSMKGVESVLSRRVGANRRVSDREISEANLQMMPGFRYSWYYTGIVNHSLNSYDEDKKYETEINQHFAREANKNSSYPMSHLFHYSLDLLTCW